MKHGLILHNSLIAAEDMVEFAVEAENSGWDGVFLIDHLVYPFNNPQAGQHANFVDPWITLAAIASRTRTISLGTWVTPIPRRQPWQVARDLATLDRLSNGRVILGAGLGVQQDYETIGQEWNPREIGRKYDEALEIIASLWTGEPLSFSGEHYEINDLAILPTPVQKPRIPIIVGCWWPNKKPVRRGARWDGIMPNWPAMLEGGQHGEQVGELVDYYLSLTDTPGDIVLLADPVDAGSEYTELCKKLGATWLLTTTIGESGTYSLDKQRIQDGPPR